LHIICSYLEITWPYLYLYLQIKLKMLRTL
jgi:hypothetical protein